MALIHFPGCGDCFQASFEPFLGWRKEPFWHVQQACCLPRSRASLELCAAAFNPSTALFLRCCRQLLGREALENQLVALAAGAAAGAVLTCRAVPCPVQQCVTSACTSLPAFLFSRPFSGVCQLPQLPRAVLVPRGGMWLDKSSSIDGESAPQQVQTLLRGLQWRHTALLPTH